MAVYVIQAVKYNVDPHFSCETFNTS